jgi:bifunctional non-homologous end joining protein LigD
MNSRQELEDQEIEMPQIAGVDLTSPDRVLWPERGTTKLALAEYWVAVAERALPHLERRPLTLYRCPSGREANCFFQKHAAAGVPEVVGRVEIPEEDGTGTYMTITGLPSVIALVQLGVLEFHVWGSRADRIDRPDRLVFDLDPDPDLKWTEVVAAALLLRDRLDDLGLRSFVKTTGGKGLHVMLPIERRTAWDDAKSFTEAIASEFASEWPHRFTDNMSKKRREGRIFIDYLRNAFNATSVAAYSTRARPGAPVSVPLAWEELERSTTRPIHDIATVPERVKKQKNDPWAQVEDVRQSVTKGMLRQVGVH